MCTDANTKCEEERQESVAKHHLKCAEQMIHTPVTKSNKKQISSNYSNYACIITLGTCKTLSKFYLKVFRSIGTWLFR